MADCARVIVKALQEGDHHALLLQARLKDPAKAANPAVWLEAALPADLELQLAVPTTVYQRLQTFHDLSGKPDRQVDATHWQDWLKANRQHAPTHHGETHTAQSEQRGETPRNTAPESTGPRGNGQRRRARHSKQRRHTRETKQHCTRQQNARRKIVQQHGTAPHTGTQHSTAYSNADKNEAAHHNVNNAAGRHDQRHGTTRSSNQ